MKAGRFLVWSLGACALLATAYLWGYGVALRQPLWPHDWLRNVYLVKDRIAADSPSPHWLIVGGSSTLFGFKSEMIAEATGQPVVNLGMHAEVPAYFQLWQAEKYLRAGDTILLAEEMICFRRERPTTYAAAQIGLMAPEFFSAAAWRQKRDLLTAVPPSRVLAGLIASAARGTPGYERNLRLPGRDQVMANVRARWSGTFAGEVPGYYNYLELDTHGDFARPRTTAAHRLETYDLVTPMPADVRVWRDLREFAARMQTRGVRCLFTWQPFERHPGIDFNAPIVRANLEHVRANLVAAGWREVGRLEDFIMDPEFFYDTGYHLTTAGAARRTDRLVERLREAGLVGITGAAPRN